MGYYRCNKKTNFYQFTGELYARIETLLALSEELHYDAYEIFGIEVHELVYKAAADYYEFDYDCQLEYHEACCDYACEFCETVNRSLLVKHNEKFKESDFF